MPPCWRYYCRRSGADSHPQTDCRRSIGRQVHAQAPVAHAPEDLFTTRESEISAGRGLESPRFRDIWRRDLLRPKGAMRRHIYALIDCASFYVSCERAFGATLQNKPTIVLSNNDGCIVALDGLAKQLGLKRGQPVFKQQAIIRKHQVQVFSSNYSLYQEMSSRVMAVLAEFSPLLEVYSIDEGWLDLTDIATDDLTKLGQAIRARVLQYTGIPVRVAIAPTKCLTKIACELIKSDSRYGDVLDLKSFAPKQLDACAVYCNRGIERARKAENADRHRGITRQSS